MTHDRLRHGEALDTLYSQLSGILLTEDALRILDTLQKLGFSLVVPELFHALDHPEHSQ